MSRCILLVSFRCRPAFVVDQLQGADFQTHIRQYLLNNLQFYNSAGGTSPQASVQLLDMLCCHVLAPYYRIAAVVRQAQIIGAPSGLDFTSPGRGPGYSPFEFDMHLCLQMYEIQDYGCFCTAAQPVHKHMHKQLNEHFSILFITEKKVSTYQECFQRFSITLQYSHDCLNNYCTHCIRLQCNETK